MRDQFKKVVEEEKAVAEADATIERRLKRKQDNPQANKKDFEDENERMGIKNPIDMVVGDPEAEAKYQKNLIGYSQEKNEAKIEKEKYLTIEGLLNHPYFIQINEADISVVIDEFEKIN